MSVPYSKEPLKCTDAELISFAELVQAGGEVGSRGLAQRIQRAARLVFVEEGGALTGIAAIKKPAVSYRDSISAKARAPLPADVWPYELGWVYVVPSARGKGLSTKLVECALHEMDAGVFATSRADNAAMHATLNRFGFVSAGSEFASDRGPHRIRLFVRAK